MSKLLRHAEEYAAAVLLGAVALLICVHLVLNWCAPRFSSPLSAIVLALFFWATMLGIPAATRRGAHLGLVFLSRKVGARWRRRLATLAMVAMVAFFVVAFATSLRLCWDQFEGHNYSHVPWLPDWVVTASLPLASLLSAIRAVEAWWEGRRARQEGECTAQSA